MNVCLCLLPMYVECCFTARALFLKFHSQYIFNSPFLPFNFLLNTPTEVSRPTFLIATRCSFSSTFFEIKYSWIHLLHIAAIAANIKYVFITKLNMIYQTWSNINVARAIYLRCFTRDFPFDSFSKIISNLTDCNLSFRFFFKKKKKRCWKTMLKV